MKKIILCADDYGQSDAISQAILQLAERKRLSATSCLVTSPSWLTQAQKLQPFKDKIGIGWHVNLTEGRPASPEMRAQGFFSLHELLFRAITRRLDPDLIYKECEAQFKLFQEGMGCLPNFIDGHQHVHHLPIVREVLFSIYEKFLLKSPCYFRSTAESYFLCLTQGVARIKRLILQLSGAHAFKRQLIKRRLPYNETFSGVYYFKAFKNYPEYFLGFLKHIKKSGMILCHPGLLSQENDPLMYSRLAEFNYFMSQEFIDACKRHQVKLISVLS